MKALLVRQTPVRVLNISQSGFLLESRESLGGLVGELRMSADGIERCEVARVGRSLLRPGANAPYLVGGEFLPGVRQPADAIQRVLVAARASSSGAPPRQKRWRKNA